MLVKAKAGQEIIQRLHKMQTGDSLELLTWKRDRSVRFVRNGGDEIIVIVRGFVEEEYQIHLSKLKKLLKTLLKREFPRSHKIRMHLEPGKTAKS